MTIHDDSSGPAPLERHWDRFVDWCAAWHRTPLPAERGTVLEYLELFPGSASTQRLRRQAIRARHENAGYPDPAAPSPEMRVWPVGDDVHQVERLLAAIPKFRFPTGVRGRRDSFLIVLLGVLGFSRGQARVLSAADIDLAEQITIDGRVIPVGEDPAGCCACAVTRWLRVVGAVSTGFRGEVLQLVDPTVGTLTTHDCGQPVAGEWRRAEQLLLPLDVHGWARTGVSLSGRAISALVPARRAEAESGAQPEVVGPVIRRPGRFDALSAAEAYDALGDADAAADRALERLAALQNAIASLTDVVDDASRDVRPSGTLSRASSS